MNWILIIFMSALTVRHPIYLTTAEIKISADRSWTGSMRIFYDDLEDAIQNTTGNRPTLDSLNLDQYHTDILEYLRVHFLISSPVETLSFSILTLSRQEDVIMIKLKGEKIWPRSKQSIKNDILTELFGSQKNVMTIRYLDELDTLYFTKSRNQLNIDI
jgi:hypothetical protein